MKMDDLLIFTLLEKLWKTHRNVANSGGCLRRMKKLHAVYLLTGRIFNFFVLFLTSSSTSIILKISGGVQQCSRTWADLKMKMALLHFLNRHVNRYGFHHVIGIKSDLPTRAIQVRREIVLIVVLNLFCP